MLEDIFRKFNTFKAIKAILILISIHMVVMSIILTTLEFPIFLQIIQIILSLGSIFLVVITFLLISRYTTSFAKASHVIEKAGNGYFYDRITDLGNGEEIGNLSINVNNLLDQLESFMQDLSVSLGFIKDGYFKRIMLNEGMNGKFISMGTEINEVLKEIELAHSKDNFIQDILIVIEEYQKGIYLNRINTGGMQPDILGLANGINTLGDKLTKISFLGLKNGLSLQNNSVSLSNNVEQIKYSADNQSNSIKETNIALEHITDNIKQNNINSDKMLELANHTQKIIENGLELSEQTSKSMHDINKQTLEILHSITSIDEIAFKTKILSLNASIEAASVGELGKGFSVVANEVRNLATNSTEVAKKIKDTIKNATLKTDEGKIISEKMTNEYITLSKNIDATLKMIFLVSGSSKEQNDYITSINGLIANLSTSVQENLDISKLTDDIAYNTKEIADTIADEAKTKEFKDKNKLINQ